MGFPEQLRKIRLEKGYSQKKLAELSGISQAAIYQWEKGTRTPKIELLQKVADALNVPLKELFSTKDSNSITFDFSSVPLNDIEKYMETFFPNLKLEREQELENVRTAEEYLEEERLENLLNYYAELNEYGQDKAIEQIKLLTKIPEYQNQK